MESDALAPECTNLQTIFEVDLETLFRPSETTLDSESKSRSKTSEAPVSQNISGPTLTLPPFYSEPFQPSQVEGENGYSLLKSNVDGFQDAAADFDDSNPININDDANFFEFPPEDNVNLSGSEVQGEHHPNV